MPKWMLQTNIVEYAYFLGWFTIILVTAGNFVLDHVQSTLSVIPG